MGSFSGSLKTVTLSVSGVVVSRADLKTKTETVTIQKDRVASDPWNGLPRKPVIPRACHRWRRFPREPGAGEFPDGRVFCGNVSLGNPHLKGKGV